MKQEITKAELARQLGVSRAHVTMLANGKRKPSEEVVNKIRKLAVNNPNYNISSLTLVSSFAAFTRSSVRIA
jgi:transcriptional regulator with XRE-family HTH domain